MGDRAIATILDLVVVGAAYALVGMWAAVRWGGVTSNGFKLYSTAANVTFGIVVIFGFLYVWLLEGVHRGWDQARPVMGCGLSEFTPAESGRAAARRLRHE
jgi:hypothetical protein